MSSATRAQVPGGRRLVATVVGALAVSGSLAGCDGGGGGSDNEIAQGSAQIFVAHVARRKVERLTGGDERHECPRWSPDGRRLSWRVVVGHDASESGRLELAAATGGAVRHVEGDMAPGTCASWSPDGRRVAFFGLSDRARELVSLDATGADRRVTAGAPVATTGEPSWSPDGRSLAFSVLRPAPCPTRYRCPRTAPRPGLPPPVSQGELSIAVPSAGEERLLTNTPTVTELFPRFSPDGSSIAFERGSIRHGAPAGPPSLALMRRDGGGTRMLVRGAPNSGLFPKWSPDGRWIAAVSTDLPGGVVQVVSPSGKRAGRIEATGDVAWSPRGDVLVVPTDGGIGLFRPRDEHWRQLVSQPPSTYTQHVAIAPDGRVVAYSDQHGVKLKDIGTGPSRMLFRLRSDEVVDDIAWSPDGRRIVFAVERESRPS
jgi:Tol biopolymer transport system component